jgi:LysR family glycine cleavage system transcriptional activator
MAGKLPPLKAIQYFEATARHLSLTRAADELHVTHSAVSHQVKALEIWLGVRLFRRVNRAVVLTDAGQAYVKPVRQAFERLGEASRLLRASESGGALTVSVMPSFAAKWLVPRLSGFRALHPDIDVRISAGAELVNFDRGDVDVAIRYGRGSWPGLRTDLLLQESLYPVCSPRLLEGPAPLRSPDDLRHHPLLQDSDWNIDFWRIWLDRAGVGDVSQLPGMSFNYSNLMLQAAIDGLGVALTHTALAQDDLAAGRLVKPFAIEIRTDYSYYVVAPESTADRPKVAAFRQWLMNETAGLPRI